MLSNTTTSCWNLNQCDPLLQEREEPIRNSNQEKNDHLSMRRLLTEREEELERLSAKLQAQKTKHNEGMSILVKRITLYEDEKVQAVMIIGRSSDDLRMAEDKLKTPRE